MDFIFDPSLVLYLPLCELNGDSFMSEDKHGHVCTVTGASWRPDGHYFDGIDDKINCGTDSSLSISTGCSIIAWVKPASVHYGTIYCHAGAEGAGEYYSLGLALALKNTGDIRFLLQNFDLSTGGGVTAGSYSAGEAFMVSGTYDSTTIKLYQNTAQVGADTSFTDPIKATATGLENLLGQWKTETGSYIRKFDGVVGELWLYNRALTPQEIQSIYLQTKWRHK